MGRESESCVNTLIRVVAARALPAENSQGSSMIGEPLTIVQTIEIQWRESEVRRRS